eukprot:gene15309-2301_t
MTLPARPRTAAAAHCGPHRLLPPAPTPRRELLERCPENAKFLSVR